MDWILLIGVALMVVPVVVGFGVACVFLYHAVSDDDEAMMIASGGLVSVVIGLVLVATHYGVRLFS